MDVHKAKNIFMLGISGSGMRGLAWLLYNYGKHIYGTDSILPDDMPHAYTLAPEIDSASLVERCDVVISTDAAPDDHRTLVHAAKKEIPIIPYHEALGQLSIRWKTIAITGTHGKSSTTAFLSHILIESGLDPTALVGARVKGWEGNNAHWGTGDLFVVEADEYRRHFLSLKPISIIIANIDFDHPDYFKDMDDVYSAYSQFLNKIPANGCVVTVDEIYKNTRIVRWPKQTIAVNDSYIEATPAVIPGYHMKKNAALACRMAEIHGVSKKRCNEALRSFPGLSRRFELIGSIKSMNIYSDYGHHPAEISSTLDAARELFTGERIAVIFEGHMVERVRSLFSDFVHALSRADYVIIYPTFVPPGRGQSDSFEIDHQLCDVLKKSGTPCSFAGNSSQLKNSLVSISDSFNICFAFSAGSLDQDLRNLI